MSDHKDEPYKDQTVGAAVGALCDAYYHQKNQLPTLNDILPLGRLLDINEGSISKGLYHWKQYSPFAKT